MSLSHSSPQWEENLPIPSPFDLDPNKSGKTVYKGTRSKPDQALSKLSCDGQLNELQEDKKLACKYYNYESEHPSGDEKYEASKRKKWRYMANVLSENPKDEKAWLVQPTITRRP